MRLVTYLPKMRCALRCFLLPFKILIRVFVSDIPKRLMLLIARLTASIFHFIAVRLPGVPFLILIGCLFLLVWNGRNPIAASWFATTLAVGAGALFSLFAIPYSGASGKQTSIRNDSYILGVSSLFMCIPAIAGCLLALKPEEEVRYFTYTMTYDSSSGEIVSDGGGGDRVPVTPMELRELFYRNVEARLAGGGDKEKKEERKRIFEEVLTALDSYEALLFHQLSVCCTQDWDTAVRREPTVESLFFQPKRPGARRKNVWRTKRLMATLTANKSLQFLSPDGGFVLPSGMNIRREDRDGWVGHALILEDNHCKVTLELVNSSGIPAIRDGRRSMVAWTRATTIQMSTRYKPMWIGTWATERRRAWVATIAELLGHPVPMPLEASLPI